MTTKSKPAIKQEPQRLLVVDTGTDEDFRDSFILVWVIQDEASKAASKAAFNAVMDMVGGLFGGAGLGPLLSLFPEVADMKMPEMEEGSPSIPLDLVYNKFVAKE